MLLKYFSFSYSDPDWKAEQSLVLSLSLLPFLKPQSQMQCSCPGFQVKASGPRVWVTLPRFEWAMICPWLHVGESASATLHPQPPHLFLQWFCCRSSCNSHGNSFFLPSSLSCFNCSLSSLVFLHATSFWFCLFFVPSLHSSCPGWGGLAFFSWF